MHCHKFSLLLLISKWSDNALSLNGSSALELPQNYSSSFEAYFDFVIKILFRACAEDECLILQL